MMGKVVTVLTEDAPKPLGHYSQAVRGGGLIHISGQLPITRSGVPDSQSASFNAQAKLVLQNFLAILDAAGAEKQDVLKVTAYVVGAENWPLFNQAFTEAFGDHRPSRSVVPVPELHHGYLIEIDGVALDPAAR
jgi:reactive intermediate/imine deaminase